MIAPSVVLGKDVSIPRAELVNLYGCEIGDGTKIGPFVEIQKQAKIGKHCKVSSHTFICSGVTVEDEVFVGHGVMFVNDLFPRSTNEDGSMQTEADWKMIPTVLKHQCAVGSNATLLCGITIGRQALVGAGAVVTKDVPDYAIVAGNPARVIGDVRNRKQ